MFRLFFPRPQTGRRYITGTCRAPFRGPSRRLRRANWSNPSASNARGGVSGLGADGGRSGGWRYGVRRKRRCWRATPKADLGKAAPRRSISALGCIDTEQGETGWPVSAARRRQSFATNCAARASLKQPRRSKAGGVLNDKRRHPEERAKLHHQKREANADDGVRAGGEVRCRLPNAREDYGDCQSIQHR